MCFKLKTRLINKMKRSLKELAVFIACLFCLSIKAQRIWTLQECLDTALIKNISINQGYLSSQIAKINLIQSKANQLPNLYLNDSHSLNSGFSLDPYTNEYTSQNISSNILSLNSSFIIYNGRVLLNTIKQNKLLFEASLLDIDKLKVDITLSVMAAFMQVLMDYEAINISKEQVSASELKVEQTEKQLQFGKVAELSLLQMRSQLASDKLLQINLENQLQLDKLTLLQLMEMPSNEHFEIRQQNIFSYMSFITPTPIEINSAAIKFMPQVKSATFRIEAANTSISIEKALGIPSLVLSGGLKTGYSSIRSSYTSDTSNQQTTIGYVNGDLSFPVTNMISTFTTHKQIQSMSNQLKNNFGEFITLALTIPIFNKNTARNNISIAKINIRVAELNEQQVKNDLRKTVETVYTNQISAGKKMTTIKEQLDLEQRTFIDMEKKYAFGAVGATDFLIEKNNFNKVSLSFIQAKYDYVLKSKIVDFYLGKSLNY